MNPTELRRLAGNTPCGDQRRYALRWAAEEIDKLNARLDFAKGELTKGKKRKHIILQDAAEATKAATAKAKIKIITIKRHDEASHE